MIAVRRSELTDVDAVRRIGLETWPFAYGGLASDEFITHGLTQLTSTGREVAGCAS